jgi:hypothetical protein
MCKKYHGTVYVRGRGKVYEDWYQTRGKGVRDLKRKARETVLNSFEEGSGADFTLSLGGQVIASGQIPKPGLYGHYAGSASAGYGLMPVGGIRIC